MNKDVKEAWVAALRSGDYVQGTGYLKQDVNSVTVYCCLGVLCDLMDPTQWSKRNRGGALYNLVTYNYGPVLSTDTNSDLNLPEQIQEQVGLYEKACTDLAAMNDTGKSFDAIATFIEETY